MIPPEKAVEAAAKALRKKFNGYEVERPWDSRDQRTTYRNDAIAALEAAAPYMLAEVGKHKGYLVETASESYMSCVQCGHYFPCPTVRGEP